MFHRNSKEENEKFLEVSQMKKVRKVIFEYFAKKIQEKNIKNNKKIENFLTEEEEDEINPVSIYRLEKEKESNSLLKGASEYVFFEEEDEGNLEEPETKEDLESNFFYFCNKVN